MGLVYTRGLYLVRIHLALLKSWPKGSRVPRTVLDLWCKGCGFVEYQAGFKRNLCKHESRTYFEKASLL